MKKYILCLANSHKYNERCIAGVELIKDKNNNFLILSNENNVRWIRPISKCEHGELSEVIAGRIKLLDIFEVDVIEECPFNYQSENVLINEKSLKIIGSKLPSAEELNLITTKNIDRIFINKGKAVIKEEIHLVNNSLILIKPRKNKFVKVKSIKAKDQLRADFFFNSINYNLPITDVDFLEKYKSNPKISDEINNLFFTISLGLEFEGWHFKLIAGLIYIP